MTIKTGDKLPEGKLIECTEFDPVNGCPVNPQTLDVGEQLKGRRIVIFGLPGAFTPTCSLRHLPGFVALQDAFSDKGIDEIWCIAVNDHFVMAAWGLAQQVNGKVRMLADGSAEYVRKLGLERDLTANGMGMRSQRFAMIVNDGTVEYLGVEGSGQFELSTAETVLSKL